MNCFRPLECRCPHVRTRTPEVCSEAQQKEKSNINITENNHITKMVYIFIRLCMSCICTSLLSPVPMQHYQNLSTCQNMSNAYYKTNNSFATVWLFLHGILHALAGLNNREYFKPLGGKIFRRYPKEG